MASLDETNKDQNNNNNKSGGGAAATAVVADGGGSSGRGRGRGRAGGRSSSSSSSRVVGRGSDGGGREARGGQRTGAGREARGGRGRGGRQGQRSSNELGDKCSDSQQQQQQQETASAPAETAAHVSKGQESTRKQDSDGKNQSSDNNSGRGRATSGRGGGRAGARSAVGARTSNKSTAANSSGRGSNDATSNNDIASGASPPAAAAAAAAPVAAAAPNDSGSQQQQQQQQQSQSNDGGPAGRGRGRGRGGRGSSQENINITRKSNSSIDTTKPPPGTKAPTDNNNDIVAANSDKQQKQQQSHDKRSMEGERGRGGRGGRGRGRGRSGSGRGSSQEETRVSKESNSSTIDTKQAPTSINSSDTAAPAPGPLAVASSDSGNQQGRHQQSKSTKSSEGGRGRGGGEGGRGRGRGRGGSGGRGRGSQEDPTAAASDNDNNPPTPQAHQKPKQPVKKDSNNKGSNKTGPDNKSNDASKSSSKDKPQSKNNQNREKQQQQPADNDGNKGTKKGPNNKKPDVVGGSNDKGSLVDTDKQKSASDGPNDANHHLDASAASFTPSMPPQSPKSSNVKNNEAKGKEKGGGGGGRKVKNENAAAEATTTSFAPAIPPNQSQQTSDKNYGRGSTIIVLHVAEKPSIAQAIAIGLCKTSMPSRSGNTKLPVHEFSGPAFSKAPMAATCKHRVTSVAGHVFNVDFSSEYQSWDSVDPAELFHAPIIRKADGRVATHLKEQGRGVDFIVLWMDCDREGENINFEVLDCCMHLMKSSNASSSSASQQQSNFDRVYRAYFSAINPSDIQKAYNSLGKPDKNQSLSVDARQELDLKVGVAFSRFQTRYFQGRYGDLDSAVLSYGPCQTPTLGFCVQRHIDIETFKPEPYWILELGVMKRSRLLRAQWDSGRSFNKGKVEQLVNDALEKGPVAVVQSFVTKDKKQGRPIPMNTVALLKACSKALGIGPHSALQTAERLYLQGYLSYPRTESSAYPKSFDIRGMLEQQVSDNRWGTYVRDLLASEGGPNRSRGGVDVGDHPPITPCRGARGRELTGDMARVYELVVRHNIAAVSKDAMWRSTKVELAIEALGDKGHFTLRGKQIVSKGFLEILERGGSTYIDERGGNDDDDEEEDEEDNEIPEFKVGELIPLANAKGSKADSSKVAVAIPGEIVRATLDIKEKITTPPGYLTESELITLMEKHGIGTDASISTHIENIQKRNYVTLESGRRLIPSKLGLVLVQGYHLIDSSLVLPRVRSDIEGECNKIAKGLASKEAVVKKAIELFRAKFDLFVTSIDKMDVLFGSSFSKLQDVGKPFTRCGLTRRYLSYIPGPPVRLYNKYTETVYPLPAGGVIKQWTGRTCPVEGCSFELCMYSIGQPERTFPLCPRCFNDPTWALNPGDFAEDAVDRQDEEKERQISRLKSGGKHLVLECPLPDKHPLIDELTVSPDPDSDGVLILDPHFGPKWRLVSTRGPTIVYLPQCIEKITVLNRKDEVLGIHMMQVHFKAGQSPLPDQAEKYVSCFPTDPVLQPLVRVHHGSDRLKASGRGGGRGRGGRGRGGGRGGRGGGRGGRR